MGNLNKALSGPHMEDIDNHERANYSNDMSPHIYANHPSMDPHIEDFDAHFIHSPEIHQPIDESSIPGNASLKNAFRKPTGQLYLIKSDSQSIEGEMLGHKMFHAAGVGHLCQKVHIHHHTMEDGEEMPTVVVHGENTPEVHCGHFSEFCQKTGVRQYELADFLASNSKFLHSMAQIDVLDHVLQNTDRHGKNLLVVKGIHQKNTEYRPVAIDHGMSLTDMPHGSLFPFTHKAVIKKTKRWWEKTGKPGILDALAQDRHMPEMHRMLIQEGVSNVDKRFAGGW